MSAFRKDIKRNSRATDSRYYLAFSLIELGRFEAAREQFDWLTANLDSHDLAAFLSGYCLARLSGPDKPAIDSLIDLIADVDADTASMFTGWNDTFSGTITGDVMTRSGVYNFDRKKLDK